jgi:myo-inositol 2-dehydrogenase / D-chiro-inositol 1-dehydrogenase
MGRMAAYTGDEISWDDAIAAKEKLVPDESELSWDKAPAIQPLAMPGQKDLV